MSKKEAVILGLIAIGGLGVASSMASDSGASGASTQRFGRILGADGKKAVASDAGGSTVYNIAGKAPPSFPAVPSISLEDYFKDFLKPSKNGGVTKKETMTEEQAIGAGWEPGMDYPAGGFAKVPVPAPAPKKDILSSVSGKKGFVKSGSGFVSTPSTRRAAGV